MRTQPYYIYILANRHRTTWIGVTGDLLECLAQSQTGGRNGFASRNEVRRLVYFEVAPDILSATERVNQIRFWVSRSKLALVERVNPEWKDLTQEWGIAGDPH